MQILFVTVGDPARLTGGYLYHREVFRRLAARGTMVEQLVAAAAPLADQLAAAPFLGRRVDPGRYDAIVVDALARAVVAPWLDGWRSRRPLVALIHELPSVAAGQSGGENQEPGEGATWEAALLRADRLIAVSDDGAGILARRGAGSARIVVAPGGFDRLLTHSPTITPRPPAPNRQRILCVAQWIPRKGVLELAEGWADLARPNWQLQLVGETEAEPAYARAVREALGRAPAGSVELCGPLSDAELAAAYAAATIFAMPSRYEGYGIAFAEALAHGLPVLGCAVGPVPALVGPNAGLLVPPEDGNALRTALARLLDDTALRERMAGAARSRAAGLPSWDDTAARFLQAVTTAVGERRKRIRE